MGMRCVCIALPVWRLPRSPRPPGPRGPHGALSRFTTTHSPWPIGWPRSGTGARAFSIRAARGIRTNVRPTLPCSTLAPRLRRASCTFTRPPTGRTTSAPRELAARPLLRFTQRPLTILGHIIRATATVSSCSAARQLRLTFRTPHGKLPCRPIFPRLVLPDPRPCLLPRCLL